ncbi:MAG: alpha-amylase [Leptolinea sp.]|nr:alpha-amylase [Leptolinea sp.]
MNGKLLIAEINTWVWINELRIKTGKPISLDTVPPEEWDKLAGVGFNTVWLMGVWKRSPRGKKISQENTDLFEEYKKSLPDWKKEDLPGSPYCVKEYTVDENLGGNPALLAAREALARRGMKLILDFVPNHVALDHRWIEKNPEFLVRGDDLDFIRNPHDYFKTKNGIFANGRDPFFPPWQDVAQLNSFSQEYRQAALDTVELISQLCDSVRCDMAMLMLNRVFSYTWQNRVGIAPATEFWTDIIPVVKKKNPDLIFIAEAYWGLEWDLQQLGFDYCYDKRLYDRMTEETAETIRQHLAADASFQSHLVRFIENHDEERAAERLPGLKSRAAATLVSTLPGAAMFYEGQWEGRRCRNHVLLGRRQYEEINREQIAFYKTLLNTVQKIPTNARWNLCEVTGWNDNLTCTNLIAYTWTTKSRIILIVINYSKSPAQGRVHLQWNGFIKPMIEFHDLMTKEKIRRDVAEIREEGLFVDLPAWGYHYFSSSG